MKEKQRIGSAFRNLKERFELTGIILILLLIIVISTCLSDKFLKPVNIFNILRQSSVTAVLAYSETLLIIMGCIDLSVGSIAALGGIFGIMVYASTGNMLLAVLAAILTGGAISFAASLFIAFLDVPPFIATLASNLVVRGFVYVVTKGQPVVPESGFSNFGQGTFFGFLPYIVVAMFIVAIVIYIIMHHTTHGRRIYAVGGNKEAANASGVNVGRVIIITYIISGMLCGLAGIMTVSRVNSGMPTTALGYETDAIAATVIGGTSFTGGVGNPWGTVIGAFIIGIIGNILNLMGVYSYVQDIFKGLIILMAVVIDLRGKRRKN
ncbi:MAG: ABC transporter permease [Eubacteriales bacterium]|nr:ABC transporter permease [Eubacteriales bacterium]